MTSALTIVAVGNVTVRSFFADHGRDLVSPAYETALLLATPEETVRATDPLEYEIAWSLGGETLTVTLDDGPAVVEVTRH